MVEKNSMLNAFLPKNARENTDFNHKRPKSILKVNFFVFVAYFIPLLTMVPIIFHFLSMAYHTKTISWKKLEFRFEIDFGKFYSRWFANSVIESGKAASISLMFNHPK